MYIYIIIDIIIPNIYPNIDIYIYIYLFIFIWVNYSDLTATSLESRLYNNEGNHPQIALFQVSEIL